MQKYLYIIFGMLMLLSCQNIERSEKPDNLIPEGKMVDVLTEISLLNSARNFNKRIFENTGITPEKYIYEKFDIDSLQFERSSNFYAENYDKYDKIYSRVKDRLDSMKIKLDSIQEEEHRIQDSLAVERKKADSLKLDSLTIDSLKVEQIPMLDSIGDPATIKVP